MITFSSVSEFGKDLKKLTKTYKSLPTDLERLVKVLKQDPEGKSTGAVRCSGLSVTAQIYKVRHFRCASLKGKGSRSGIRVIYARGVDENNQPWIRFIEIYHKNRTDDLDRARVKQYY